MDAKSLETLDLSKILDRLADYAAFSASKALARELAPTEDLKEAHRRQRETTEARYLLSMNAEYSIGGAHDIRPMAEAAARGSVLETIQLLDIKATLIAARRQSRFFGKARDLYPTLCLLADGLKPAPGLVDAISSTLDDQGEVLDDASPELLSIRRNLKNVHDRLLSKLERLISDPKKAAWLQEPIITQRDGRYVVPLRAENKGRIKGVVHDRSSSGATIFIEPLTVVDMNNQIRELRLAERDEVRRILAELSSLVGEHEEDLASTVQGLAAIDIALAKARYAEDLKANEPVLHESTPQSEPPCPGTTIRLYAARHPLLNPDMVVPIDLILEPDTYALVITGPNTGGKTVALKTAGLLALMAQCGMHIPVASGSELSVFSEILADIGDEQSIEQSLSTFSANISNITRLMSEADERSLVLLDELGAGTDPQEGAALAQAILNELLCRRVTTLVATHYPELKTFAHATRGVRNACVEFDIESLRPTYHLTIGLPGRSNALAIAERLGLDMDIIDRARGMLAADDLTAESLLNEIYRQREASHSEWLKAEQAYAETESLRAELDRRLDGIEGERREILQQARAEGQDEIDKFQSEIDLLRKRLKDAGEPLKVLEDIKKDLERVEEKTEEPIEKIQTAMETKRRQFKPGDRVKIKTIDSVGVVTGLKDGQAEVQIGRLRVRAQESELEYLNEEMAEDTKPGQERAIAKEGVLSPRRARPKVPPLELDLRGQTVDEGLDEIDRRLDAAFLAGMPFIRVIHGKGTGRLRRAIRKWLKSNPYVQTFETGSESEGGEGVTIIRIKSD